jgi:phage tail-like protein
MELYDESFEHVVARWTLVDARPVRWTGPTLDAIGQDLAMEEIELTYERLEWAAPEARNDAHADAAE